MNSWNVTENNGGGLTLNIFNDDDELIYIHSGYEYNVGQLTSDIRAMYEDSDDLINPEDWDGNEIEELRYDAHPTTSIIAEGDENGYKINVSKMGAAGLIEFCK